MSADSLEAVQTKIAFLEKANNELSDVVYRQQEEIRVLGARVTALAERLEAIHYSGAGSPDDERPPHY